MVYCVNERSSLLCVGQKHKMKVFSFLGGLSGFSLKKDLTLPESPRILFSTGSGGGCLIIGFKKHYESLDMHSFATTKLLDFEREHKLVCVEVSIYSCFTETVPSTCVICNARLQQRHRESFLLLYSPRARKAR